MKTLPAAIIAGMDGDSDRIILVRIIPESGDTWAELCWATKDITVLDWEGGSASKSFAGSVLAEGKLGTIRQSVDIEQGGNVATVSGLTITIRNAQYNNDDRFDQSFTGDLENRRVEIWRAFWTGSSPAWSDTLLLYKGVVEDTDYDHETYKIKVQDVGFKRHKNIPDLILTEDDYTAIPDYNKGKIAPLLFGQLSTGSIAPWYGANNSIPIIRSDKNKENFIISRNKIDSTAIRLVSYFDDVNRWARLYGGVFSFTYGRPSKVEYPLGLNILARYYSQLEKQGSQTNPTSLDFKNAVDDSNTTYFTLGASEKLYLRAPMPAEFGRIMDEANNVLLFIEFGEISGTGTVNYYNPEWDDGIGGYSTGEVIDNSDQNKPWWWKLGGDKTAHGRHPTQDDQNDPWTFDELATIEMGLTMDAASSTQIKNIWLEIDGLLVKADRLIIKIPYKAIMITPGHWKFEGGTKAAKVSSLRDADSVCVDILDGADFNAWIDQDGRDNGFTAGDYIRRGCYLIEAILRDELNLISDEIDYDSFDTVGNITDGDRKDWYHVAVIDNQDNSLKFLAEFCRYSGLIYFQNYQNKEKIVALKKKVAVKTIDRTTIQEDSIGITLSDLRDVLNEFYLNFDRLWVADNYRKTLYITASDNNLSSNSRSGTPNTYTGLCSDSQSKYNTTKRLTIDCDWINDAATAELLIKWLAEWLCYRKYIVEFKSTGLEHINLELGDQIKIDHTLLPAGVSDDDSFIVFDIKDDLDNDRMTFKCMQIPDLLP